MRRNHVWRYDRLRSPRLRPIRADSYRMGMRFVASLVVAGLGEVRGHVGTASALHSPFCMLAGANYPAHEWIWTLVELRESPGELGGLDQPPEFRLIP
jgi:hypothetical protein